jgi:hypothetical protein
MNQQQLTTFTAPADDSQILSLFREWLGLYRAAEGIPNTFKGFKEFDAARERLDALTTEVIAKVPAAGAAGIAIKAFLRLHMEDPPLGTVEKSLLEDAARFVPELAPLATAMVARAAEQGTGTETRATTSDGLTAAERRLGETLGPHAALYEAALSRMSKSPAGEIGFGEPDE